MFQLFSVPDGNHLLRVLAWGINLFLTAYVGHVVLARNFFYKINTTSFKMLAITYFQSNILLAVGLAISAQNHEVIIEVFSGWAKQLKYLFPDMLGVVLVTNFMLFPIKIFFTKNRVIGSIKQN